MIVSVDDIKTNPENPRVIKDEKFKQLVKSIKDFPEMIELRPIVVNDEMIVLGGNMRLRACVEAGLKEIPVIKASSLTAEQQKEFIIKDNIGFGEWDWEIIANEWDTEQVTDWGLDIPDFALQKEAHEDDYEMPDEVETDIVVGDLIEIGCHKLLCADSTEIESWAKLNLRKEKLICFCSPPYNVSKNARLVGNTHASHRESLYSESADSSIDYDEILRKSLENAISSCEGVAFNVQPLANNKISLINWISSFSDKFNEIITWNKGAAAPAMAQGVCTSKYEWIVIFSENGTRRIPVSSWRGKVSNVYDGPPQRNNEFSEHHAATFPIHLPSFVISELMNISREVIDCFMGTGTTMVAAHQLGRKCYGIELSPKYCQIIIDRMKKLDPNIEIKKNGQVIEKLIAA